MNNWAVFGRLLATLEIPKKGGTFWKTPELKKFKVEVGDVHVFLVPVFFCFGGQKNESSVFQIFLVALVFFY